MDVVDEEELEPYEEEMGVVDNRLEALFPMSLTFSKQFFFQRALPFVPSLPPPLFCASSLTFTNLSSRATHAGRVPSHNRQRG